MGKVIDSICKSENLSSPRIRELLGVLESLPGIAEWHPERHEWQRIILWSKILEQIRDLESMADLIEDFRLEILKDNKPKAATLSEMSAAALTRSLGCELEKIQRTHERTPDFLVSTKDGELELEITRADPKQAHADLAGYGNKVLKLCHNSGRGHDLVIMLADVPCNDEEALQKTASSLQPGQVHEIKDRWKMVAEPYRQKSDTIAELREFNDLPSWWPCKYQTQQHLKIKSMITLTPDTPTTTVACAAVIKGYLNPLRRKAGHFQGSSEKPLLLGVDVENLPGAFVDFEQELPARFKVWKHISGVLAYQPYLRPDKIGWMFKLFKNPFSEVTIPLNGAAPEGQATLMVENVFKPGGQSS